MKKYIILFLFFEIFIFSFFPIYANNENDMVFIKGGTYVPLFKVSSNELENIKHINSFFIDKYPVTNLEFKNFILNNNSWSYDKINLIFADKNYLSHWKNFDNIINKPVVNISWFAANAYCEYFNKKLPSIDEWEYLLTLSNFYKDENLNSLFLQKMLDWYINSNSTKLLDVNLMESNLLGIYGLYGNIWEWVEDFNSVILLNTDAEGGGLEEMLYCSASAINSVDPANYVAFMRYAFRNSLEANYTMSYLGFRCVKNVD